MVEISYGYEMAPNGRVAAVNTEFGNGGKEFYFGVGDDNIDKLIEVLQKIKGEFDKNK